MKRLFNSLSSQ